MGDKKPCSPKRDVIPNQLRHNPFFVNTHHSAMVRTTFHRAFHEITFGPRISVASRRTLAAQAPRTLDLLQRRGFAFEA